MKASYSKKGNLFFFTALATAVVCCLITTASYHAGVSSIAASGLGIVVSPLQKLFSGTHDLLDDCMTYFRSIDRLKEENRALQAELTDVKRQLSELKPAQKENEMLYSFLELKKERSDITFVNADVISRSVSNYTSDFTIDKGSVHGIQKDMPVVSEDNSLLGIIVEVGATYSRGKTLTSYDLNVGIKNERTGEPGILSGSFELSRKNLCRVTDLTEKSDYAAGDIIRTSGLGDIYPPGLYIGSVTELVPDGLSYTVSATVKPSGSVFDSDMVMVITDFDRTYELPANEQTPANEIPENEQTPANQNDAHP